MSGELGYNMHTFKIYNHNIPKVWIDFSEQENTF